MSSECTTVNRRTHWHYFLIRLPSGRPAAELAAVVERYLSAQSPLVAAQTEYLGTLDTRAHWRRANPRIDKLLAHQLYKNRRRRLRAEKLRMLPVTALDPTQAGSCTVHS
jgi:hypothetical protein